MLSAALPEGVLTKGTAQGFLYFQHVDPGKVKEVEFVFDVLDADTGENLGKVELPLVTSEDRVALR